MSKQIFLLEDETMLGEIYQRRLQKEGFAVQWVTNTQDLYAGLKRNKVDVVLIDNGLKNESISGLDIIPKIRKLLPYVRIIMLSNYSAADLQKKAIKAGADDYLVKMNISPKALAYYLKKTIEVVC